MAKTLRGEADLLHGPVLQNMLRFALPILAGTLLQQLYSMVDAVVVGQFVGKTALAAVGGSAVAIINLLLNFFVGLCSGAAIVVAQYYGAHDRENVSRAVHTATLLAVWVGAVMTVIGVCFAPGLLSALDTPEDTMQYSIDYMRWYFAGMIPTMIYNMGSSILRAMGDSKRPLYFLLLCTGVNTVLDLLCVAVLRLEVAGAAIATSLSQLICAAFVLRSLMRRRDEARLELAKLRPTPALVKRMLLLGLPAGLQSVLYNVTNLYVQKAVNLMGTDTVAAWSIYAKIDGVFWPISNAFGIAIMTFVGQNYGAQQHARITSCIRTGLWMDAGFSILFSVLLFFSRSFVVRFFTDDPAVMQEGGQIIAMLAFFYPTFVFVEILSSAMRGTGNSVIPTVLTLFGVCVLRLVLLFTVTFPHLSDWTVALCYPATWATTSVLFLIYYKCFRWMPACREKAQGGK